RRRVMKVRNERSNSARKKPRPTSSISPPSEVGTPVLSGSVEGSYGAPPPPAGCAPRAASSAGTVGSGGGDAGGVVGGIGSLMGVLPHGRGSSATLSIGDAPGEYVG